jgi:3-methyladenine DNA glycosylase AlkD
MSYSKITEDLKKLKNPDKAKNLQRFFKTGKGEYGEGDVFLGIVVPLQRKVAMEYKDLSLSDIKNLLASKFHEHRLTALFILDSQFKNAEMKTRKEIFEFYLENINHINNWDLVDLSAPNIVGEYLYQISVGEKLCMQKIIVFEKLSTSENLWVRRISILATFSFIRHGDFEVPLSVFERLIQDKEDLIHKAVGWMLREIGKRDLQIEIAFLDKHYKNMPRTMLRYAIEKFDEEKREKYLSK